MLESARQQWEEGSRRLEAETADEVRYGRLVVLVEAVTDELRRRVGQTFTLVELAGAYSDAEDWVREVVQDVPAEAPARAGVRDVALVQDAAFHAYSRGASDYRC